MPCQQIHLKGEDAQHMINAAADFLDPIGAPGPDRRANKVNGLDAFSFERGFQIQIEIGCVHANKHIGALLQQPSFELIADAHDFPVMTQHLHVATHGKLVAGPPGVEATPCHLRPANAVCVKRGPAFLQTIKQQAGQQVPGGLAGHHAQSRGGHHRHFRRASAHQATLGASDEIQ